MKKSKISKMITLENTKGIILKSKICKSMMTMMSIHLMLKSKRFSINSKSRHLLNIQFKHSYKDSDLDKMLKN